MKTLVLIIALTATCGPAFAGVMTVDVGLVELSWTHITHCYYAYRTFDVPLVGAVIDSVEISINTYGDYDGSHTCSHGGGEPYQGYCDFGLMISINGSFYDSLIGESDIAAVTEWRPPSTFTQKCGRHIDWEWLSESDNDDLANIGPENNTLRVFVSDIWLWVSTYPCIPCMLSIHRMCSDDPLLHERCEFK